MALAFNAWHWQNELHGTAPCNNDHGDQCCVRGLLFIFLLRTNIFFRYSYDITKCMFSSGNVTEKLRVAKFDCTNEVVVDLYAGMQYFI